MKSEEIYGVRIAGLACEPEEWICTRKELIQRLPFVAKMLVNPLEIVRLAGDYGNPQKVGTQPLQAPSMTIEANYFGTTYKITLLSVQIYYTGWHISWTLSNAVLPEP